MTIRKKQKPKEVSTSDAPATIVYFNELTIMDDATMQILNKLKDKLKG